MSGVAYQFGAPFGSTQPETEARCARQAILRSLRSHTNPKPHRGSGFFFVAHNNNKKENKKSKIRCSLRSRTQSGHFLCITDRQTDRQTDRRTDRQKIKHRQDISQNRDELNFSVSMNFSGLHPSFSFFVNRMLISYS